MEDVMKDNVCISKKNVMALVFKHIAVSKDRDNLLKAIDKMESMTFYNNLSDLIASKNEREGA